MNFIEKVIWFAALFWVLSMGGTAWADPGRGRMLFKDKHCVLCHDITQPGTVFRPMCPGLKGVRDRHSKEWVRDWLKDPARVWAENGEDVRDINHRYFQYRGSKPKPRESFMATVIGKRVVLTDEEIEALIEYLWTL